MVKTENFEQVPVHSQQALRNWLLAHHNQAVGVWLVTFKKQHADRYVSTGEVLDELLCFGWIDGVRRKLDADRTMQLITPRKAQHWTQTYKMRYAKLLKAGRVHPAGMQAVAASKKAGMWNFMDDVDQRIKPADLVEALQQYPAATANFDAFAPSAQRFMLRWIKLSKTAATRTKRIAEVTAKAPENKKIAGV